MKLKEAYFQQMDQLMQTLSAMDGHVAGIDDYWQPMFNSGLSHNEIDYVMDIMVAEGWIEHRSHPDMVILLTKGFDALQMGSKKALAKKRKQENLQVLLIKRKLISITASLVLSIAAILISIESQWGLISALLQAIKSVF